MFDCVFVVFCVYFADYACLLVVVLVLICSFTCLLFVRRFRFFVIFGFVFVFTFVCVLRWFDFADFGVLVFALGYAWRTAGFGFGVGLV